MLRRLFTRPAEERSITKASLGWGDWQGETQASWSGEDVSRDSSLQLLTVYGCVRLIADSIATMPVDVFRKRDDGTREEVPTPDWLSQPTIDLDYTAWCTQVLTSLLLDGNAYVVVVRNAQGRIVELIPVDPAMVSVVRIASRKVVLINGAQVPYDVLHLKGAMLPGSDVGMSPVEYARQTIGLGLATVKHGAQHFSKGMQIPGVIEIPGESTPDRNRELALQWQRKHSGTKGAHLPGVLDGGATWRSTGVTNEQAQFLETRGFTAAEIAGQMFLIDPSDLGIGVAGSSLTYANLLERSTRRVQVAFMPWIVRLEQALSSLLARPRYVKVNVDGLLRGSPEQRWSVYQRASAINVAAHNIGMPPVLLTSEMREYEDMGPVEAGVAVNQMEATNA